MKLTVPRRLRATVPVGRILATLALTAGLAGSALPAQAAPAEAGTENATGWYLALGDSVGAGYQPGAGDDLDGGYPGGVLDALQGTDPKLRLRNLSCSGEDLTTIMQGAAAPTTRAASSPRPWCSSGRTGTPPGWSR